MPVDSTHPLYDARLTQWQKCRHAYEGEDAIKKAGVLYLPKLKGQTDEDYKAYKQKYTLPKEALSIREVSVGVPAN